MEGHGRLDVLVNGAGRTQVGALEETTEAETRYLPGAFRTGLFGKDAAYLSSPMPEYAETVGPTRAYVQTGGGSQPGDPVKAARAILTAMSSAKPPLRLVLGGDAIDRIRQRLGHLQDELTEWEELGRDTALDE